MLNIISHSFDRLESIDKVDILAQNLKRGIVVSSDFSGYESPREGLRILLSAMQHKFEVDPEGVRFLRSSDIGAVQRYCLQLQNETFDNGASCIFGNILDRLSPEVRRWVEAAKPSRGGTSEQGVAANTAIHEFLQKNRGTAFAKDTNCLTCCPLNE